MSVQSSKQPEAILGQVEVPSSLRSLLQKLWGNGHEAYCVGGAVRDVFLARPSGDWDVATSALPTQVQDIFERVVETGIAHGTVTVCLDDASYEVTTYRIDVGASDGRHPDSVTFSDDLVEDLRRRDFTMNAMAWDPLQNVFHDPFDGLGALNRRQIEAVGDPVARLSEDGLRSMRAVRFSSTLGFTLSADLEEAVLGSLDTFSKVSVERVWQELRKLLLGIQAEVGLSLLESSGMRACFWPAADSGHHIAIDQLPNNLSMRLAYYFSQQPDVFANCAKALRLPNKLIRTVTEMLTNTRISLGNQQDRYEALQSLAKIGRDGLEDWYVLQSSLLPRQERGLLDERMVYLRALSAESVALRIAELPIDGAWLMSTFGLTPSRQIGELLEHCLREFWRDPALSGVDGCYEVVRKRLAR